MRFFSAKKLKKVFGLYEMHCPSETEIETLKNLIILSPAGFPKSPPAGLYETNRDDPHEMEAAIKNRPPDKKTVQSATKRPNYDGFR